MPQGSALVISVVDDHPIVGAGALATLERAGNDFAPGRNATSVEALLRAESGASRADLVLLDLSLGDGSSPSDNIDRLRAAGYRVLVYTSELRPERLTYLLGKGISGLVSKTDDESVIVEAVAAIATDESTFVSPLMTQIAMAAPQGPHLQPREREVLRRYALGDSGKRIARDLDLTVATVASYLKKIRRAYADHGEPFSSRTDALQKAIRDGVVEDAPWS